jgi:hypothetical protein
MNIIFRQPFFWSQIGLLIFFFVYIFIYPAHFFAMDNSSFAKASADRPAIPKEVKASFQEAMWKVEEVKRKAREDMKGAEEGTSHPHHSSRTHSSMHIEGTVTDEQGHETKLEIKEDGTVSRSGDPTPEPAERANDGCPKVVTHGVTAVVTGLIGAGVTIAIKYGDCQQ